MSAEPLNLLHVRTPEGVAFTFRLASPVLRLAALIVDWATVTAAWSILATGLVVLRLLDRDVAGFVTVVAYFILTLGYGIATEWLWRGQSLGKRLLRLRVVDERGWRLTFVQVVLRNLLRLVDALPMAYLVGGIAALTSRRGQRLGDLAAGTLVIWEPADVLPSLPPMESGKYNSLRTDGTVVARLRQAVVPREARVAWQALVRRGELDAEARVRLFADLAAHFRQLSIMPPEISEGVSDEQFVRNVVDVLYTNQRR